MKNGWTVIESMIVLAIFGILLAMILPACGRKEEPARGQPTKEQPKQQDEARPVK